MQVYDELLCENGFEVQAALIDGHQLAYLHEEGQEDRVITVGILQCISEEIQDILPCSKYPQRNAYK